MSNKRETIQKINQLYTECSGQIKPFLLEQVARFKEFPKVTVGVPYAHGSNEGTSFGRGVEVPGIMILDAGKFWTENEYVLMLQDGLYVLRAGLFEANDEEGIIAVRSRPDWESRYEGGYLTHAISAYEIMERLLQENSRNKRRE